VGIDAYTLSPGQSVKFTAIVREREPCRIAVRYQPSDLNQRQRALFPAWLARRLPWLNRDPIAMTPVIDLSGKNRI
jgi:hypothetical protein